MQDQVKKVTKIIGNLRSTEGYDDDFNKVRQVALLEKFLYEPAPDEVMAIIDEMYAEI